VPPVLEDDSQSLVVVLYVSAVGQHCWPLLPLTLWVPDGQE
jgi:hypothetical protein